MAENVLQVTERILQEASSAQPVLIRSISQEVGSEWERWRDGGRRRRERRERKREEGREKGEEGTDEAGVKGSCTVGEVPGLGRGRVQPHSTATQSRDADHKALLCFYQGDFKLSSSPRVFPWRKRRRATSCRCY